MYNILYKKFIKNPTTIHSVLSNINRSNKYEIFYSMIYANPFLLNSTKKELINYFCKMQKTHNAFTIFYNKIYKNKYLKTSNVEFDLGCTLIYKYPKHLLIHIIEDDTIYPFYIYDLINIIKYSLSNHNRLFAEPLLPKNPWTSLPFSKQSLYQLYFKFLDNQMQPPLLFYLYFKSEFNIKHFQIENEAVLRDIHLKTYYKDYTQEEMYDAILNMIDQFKHPIRNINIHKKYPIDKVVESFKSLLYDFTVYEYSYNPTKRRLSGNKIKRYLRVFHTNNPLYGRIVIQTK